MTKTNYIILDDFKARQIYEKAIFYSAMDGHKDEEIIKRSADNIQNKWRKDVLKFIDLETEVRLKLYNYTEALNKNSLPKHTLHIEFFGKEVEATRRKLEQITGIEID